MTNSYRTKAAIVDRLTENASERLREMIIQWFTHEEEGDKLLEEVIEEGGIVLEVRVQAYTPSGDDHLPGGKFVTSTDVGEDNG